MGLKRREVELISARNHDRRSFKLHDGKGAGCKTGRGKLATDFDQGTHCHGKSLVVRTPISCIILHLDLVLVLFSLYILSISWKTL